MAFRASWPRRVLPLILAAAFVAIGGALLWRGWSFYGLTLEDRVEHPEFRTLRASGVIGHGYGVVAGALVLLNLAYLIRRRLAGARLGPMWVWLDFHVFTGFLAAAFAAVHSAFILRMPIAVISAAGFALVVTTGLVGRFLFALATGDDGRLRRALEAVRSESPEIGGALAVAIEALPAPTVPRRAALIRGLLAIPAWRRVARQRVAVIRVLAPDRGAAVVELERAAAADARAAGMAAVLRGWRGVHRFAAFLMIAAVVFHAVVAWRYGYRWVL